MSEWRSELDRTMRPAHRDLDKGPGFHRGGFVDPSTEVPPPRSYIAILHIGLGEGGADVYTFHVQVVDPDKVLALWREVYAPGAPPTRACVRPPQPRLAPTAKARRQRRHRQRRQARRRRRGWA